jgi:hypothetical protein
MTDQTPANVVPFDGFKTIDGNFTQVPNQVFELMPTLSGSELKCLLYIVRHTLGFRDKVKTITIDEFEHGRKLKTGERMDDGVGMGRETIINALKALAERAIITRDLDARDKARQKITYGLHQSDNPTSDNQSEKPTASDGKSDRQNRKSRPRSVKETIGDTPIEEKIVAAKSAATDADAKPKRKRKPKDAPKPRSECENEPVYEAVERYLFEITDATPDDPYLWDSPQGLITRWLLGRIAKIRTSELGYIKRAAEAHHVESFVRWFQKTYKDASLPTGPVKFVSQWRKFGAAMAKKSTPAIVHIEPEPIYTPTEAEKAESLAIMRANNPFAKGKAS